MQNDPTTPTGSTVPGVTSTGMTGTAGSTSGMHGTTSTNDQVADRARHAAHDVKDQAARQVRSGLETAKSRAADSLHDVARTLKQSCENRSDGPAHYISAAGDRVQRAADYLERTDPREMMSQTERFARNQPALFLGGAFALGLLAARFLKSSRDEQSTGTDRWNAGADSRGRLYDREESLAGYREPTAGSTAARPMSTRVGPTTPLGATGATGIGGATAIGGATDATSSGGQGTAGVNDMPGSARR